MMAEKKRKVMLTREQSLDAKPIATEIVEQIPLPDGGARVRIPLRPSPWKRRLLRVPDDATREFELDAMGVWVLELCDGNKPVRYIVKRMAREYSLHPTEAESAVIAFLRTLMQRGMVSMVVPKSMS